MYFVQKDTFYDSLYIDPCCLDSNFKAHFYAKYTFCFYFVYTFFLWKHTFGHMSQTIWMHTFEKSILFKSIFCLYMTTLRVYSYPSWIHTVSKLDTQSSQKWVGTSTPKQRKLPTFVFIIVFGLLYPTWIQTRGSLYIAGRTTSFAAKVPNSDGEAIRCRDPIG